MEAKDITLGFNNLYEAAMKCRRNVGWKDSVAHFCNRSLFSIWKLRRRILDGGYDISPYSIFTIFEPKKRLITSTRFVDRVFQRSMCDNYLYDEITKGFLPNNFACQKGKGTDRAREHLDSMIREFHKENGMDGYFLKMDIKDYFGSTDHGTAIKQVRKRVGDGWCNDEVERIITSFERGIGLGSQVSQLIQLSVLDGVDHYITEKLGIKHYVRYMDDFILLHQDKEHLRICLRRIGRMLEKLKLKTSPKKTKIIPMGQPIRFLGFTFKAHATGKVTWRLPKDNIRKERRKLRKLAGKVSKEDFEACYKSWRAHASKTDSRGRVLKWTDTKRS